MGLFSASDKSVREKLDEVTVTMAAVLETLRAILEEIRAIRDEQRRGER
jgi:hypothetical protein